jgi:signal transduction histidine kinase
LPRAVDIAAYRIVQEALTNVARHAQPPVATVAVHRSRNLLTVSVADSGTGHRRPDPLPRGGNGIPGMRERAASVGGTFVAGPRLGVGFTVEAHIPLPDGHDTDEHDTVANGATGAIVSGDGTGGSQ